MDGAGNAPALIVTLGCRLNTADSALLATRLSARGYRVVESADAPALIVVNSCAVTAEAVRKTRQLLRRLRREHPAAKIVAVGCAVDAAADGLAADGADLVIPNREKHLIAEKLGTPVVRTRDTVPEVSPVFREDALSSFPFRSRAFIKIQEGCNNFCTYCIVPHLRGRERSRMFAEVIEDCRHAVAAGFPEVVLTGVNTCAYRDGERGLGDVVRAVGELPGDFRIRLSSTEPHPDNRRLTEVMAAGGDRVCRFLHLSLQHGSDRILARMNRHYSCAEYAAFACEAKRLLPGLHLGTDVIAGFPGESDGDFAESLEFIRSIGFANIHIFSYSPRPGTPAADYPDRVSPETVKERVNELRRVADEAAAAFRRSQLGRMLPVIFEREENGLLRGWSDNYIEVSARAGAFPLRKIVEVEATMESLALHPRRDEMI